MPTMDKWFNVNEDAQIWSGHSDNHQKQGWLRAPAAIRAIDYYGGSYQFVEVLVDEELGGRDERDPATTNYPQYWIRETSVSILPFIPDPDPEPEPDPEPTPEPGDDPSDSEIARVIRYLFGR